MVFCKWRQVDTQGVLWIFLGFSGTLLGMDKAEHGRLLKAAMARKGHDRAAIAEWTDVKPRTVTNWTSGSTEPNSAQKEALRRLLGPYDQAGDAVELALRASSLVKWRQDRVISEYERQVHEQRREEAG